MQVSYVYILTNITRKVLYTGVTSNLHKRVAEHKNGTHNGFTKRYGVKYLLYYEEFQDIKVAINREKQIKRWRREKKEALINSFNPNLDFLCENWY